MTKLYLLRRPVRDILDEWLESRDADHPLKDKFDKEDRLFSTDNNNYDRENAHTIGPSLTGSSTSADEMPALEFDPTKLTIICRLSHEKSESIVLKVKWDGVVCVLKVNQQSVGDLVEGRDRHSAERNAYNQLLQNGLCNEGTGVAPHPYGYFHIWGRQHPRWDSHRDKWPYELWLQQITNPAEYPRAILMEYIPNVTRLSTKEFTVQNIRDLLDAVEKIHTAGVVHSDISSWNVLWNGSRFVIIDYEKAQLSANGQAINWAGTTRDLQELWKVLMRRTR